MNLLSYFFREKKTPQCRELPVILLINPLSGGNKGMQVIELLEKQKNEKIKIFNLMRLAQMEDHFNAFVDTLSIIIKDLIAQAKNDENRSDDQYEHEQEKENKNKNERKYENNEDNNSEKEPLTANGSTPTLKRWHPRILICGGDGTIAWGLSFLDRALLQPPILSLYEQLPEFQQLHRQLLTKRLSRRLSMRVLQPQEKTKEEEMEAEKPEKFANNESFGDKNQNEIVQKFIDKSWSSFDPDDETTLLNGKDQDHNNDIPAENDQYNQNNESDNAAPPKDIWEDNKAQQAEEKVVDIINGTADNKPKDAIETKKEEEELEEKKKELEETRKRDLLLQAIYYTHLAPVFSVLPFGTGNNFCRCIGTGHSYPKSNRVVSVVENLMKDHLPLTRVDRWNVIFKNHQNEPQKRQMSEMMCYFSIGAIAQISHSFRAARLEAPDKLNKRWKNKFQYLVSGGKTAFEELTGSAKPLNALVDLYVDHNKIELPTHCRSIVVSNLSSMADGINFWGTSSSDPKDIQTYSEPSLGDGLLEIMASKGLYKYVQMSMGVSHYRRLGQSHHVSVRIHGSVPILIDGEAWVESAGTIEFHLKNQMIAVVGNAEQPRGLRSVS